MRLFRRQCLLGVLALMLGPNGSIVFGHDFSSRIAVTESLDLPADFELTAATLPLARAAGHRWLTSMDDDQHLLGRNAWYRLRLQRQGEGGLQQSWLRLRSTYQRHSEAFLVFDSRIVASASSGYMLPTAQHTSISQDLTLPLEAWSGKAAEVYVRVDARQHPFFSPAIISGLKLKREIFLNNAVPLFFYGGALFMMLVQVVLYRGFRDRHAALNAAFALSLVLTAVSRYGHFDSVFAGRLGDFYLGDWIVFFRMSNSVLGMYAIASFLEFHRHFPRVQRAIHVLAAFHALAALCSPLLELTALDRFVSTGQLASICLCLATNAIAMRRGILGAEISLAAWGGLAVAGITYDLMQLDLLPRASLADLIPTAGVLWQMLVSTLGLTYKFRRVSQFKQEKELREAEATHLDRLVRVLCHDISNPLTVIRFVTDRLDPVISQGRPFAPEKAVMRLRQAEASIVETIANARALRQLKELDGKVPLHPVEVVTAMEHTLGLFEERIASKGLVVERRYPLGHHYVQAEGNLLRTTLFSNALSNALKFSDAGQVIQVAIVPEPASGHILVRIIDHGVGIPADHRATYNQLGYIASRSGTQNEVGTGFGVMLMRDYARAMGGDFHLHSSTEEEAAVEKGTTIEFRFKAAAPPHRPSLSTQQASCVTA